MSVPIESPYATSYTNLSYLALFRSYRRLLFKFWMKNGDFSFLSPVALEEIRGNVRPFILGSSESP